MSVVERARALASWTGRTHAVRTYQTYTTARGNTFAGGIAYAGLFSVFGALLVGFTIFSLVLGRRSDLREPVLDAIDLQLPGLLDRGDGRGLVAPGTLFAQDLLSLTGVVAFVVALWAGLRWLDAGRQGIRAVFGAPFDDRPLLRKKLGDLGILVTLGLAILASAVLSIAVNSAAGFVLDVLGLERAAIGSLVLRLAGILVVLVVDTLIFVVLFRLLSRVPLSWPDVRTGAFVGAVGLGLLKLFGGVLLSRISGSNPLLATSAVLIGLLVWMNLVSRVMLLAAAWVATENARERRRTAARAAGAVAAGGGAAGRARRNAGDPAVGRRAADRVTIAAGAVLGALAVASLRVVSGAVRASADAVRDRD